MLRKANFSLVKEREQEMAVKPLPDRGYAHRDHPLRGAELAASALLLLRLALNDGVADSRTTAVLRRTASEAFGMDAFAMRAVMPTVDTFGAESTAQATNLFRARPKEERLQLAAVLLAVARQDEALKEHETRLRGRLAVLLDMEEGELA